MSYDDPTRTATLTPSAALEASTSYTATVKGGASGVKDLAGNALAADSSWSFTTGTGGGGPPAPSGTSYLSDLTATSTTSGYGPVEKDKSNGGFAGGDGLTITLNGTTYAKGLGVHAASDVQYALGGTCTRFKASVGVDDEVGANGSVVFQVFADATKVYDSGADDGRDRDQDDRRQRRERDRRCAWSSPTAATGSTSTTATGRSRGSTAEASRTRPRRRSPRGHPRQVRPESRSRPARRRPSRESINPSTLTTTHLHADQAGHLDPARGERVLRRSDAHGDAHPERRARGEHELHGDRQGRRLGRQGPGRQRARRRLSWSFTTGTGGGGPDTTPPTITARTPRPGATGVALSTSPTATFSREHQPEHADDHAPSP